MQVDRIYKSNKRPKIIKSLSLIEEQKTLNDDVLLYMANPSCRLGVTPHIHIHVSSISPSSQ